MNYSNEQLIGLVGGVGPWAGIDVHRKILEATPRDSEQDYLSVIHISCPGNYPDRTEFLLGKTPLNPAGAFIRELQQLEKMGAKTAAIVCNTAHAEPIFAPIRAHLENSQLIYISIIEATQEQLIADGISNAGLLATLGTYTSGLFSEKFPGTMLHPGKQTQQRVHDIMYCNITGIKACYPQTFERQRSDLLFAAEELLQKGAKAVVLGCTELPLIARWLEEAGIPFYDPNRILANRLVAAVRQPDSDTIRHMYIS